jgi:hypothetical protein
METTMDFARIRRASRPIDLAEWAQIIASHPALEQMPDRTGINPFTKEKVLFSGKEKPIF